MKKEEAEHMKAEVEKCSMGNDRDLMKSDFEKEREGWKFKQEKYGQKKQV